MAESTRLGNRSLWYNSDNKDWNFSNQICRLKVSISNNIAEGFELLITAQ